MVYVVCIFVARQRDTYVHTYFMEAHINGKVGARLV